MMSAHRPHRTQVNNVDSGLARYARKSTKPGFNEASQGDGKAFLPGWKQHRCPPTAIGTLWGPLQVRGGLTTSGPLRKDRGCSVRRQPASHW